MGNYIVAVAVDKVQKFLYETIHAHTKETQRDQDTLRRIIGASWLISEQFYREVGLSETDKTGAFSGAITETLLECSGVCIFTTSLAKEVIEENLGRLFLQYYRTYNGNLLLKYVCFEALSTTDEEKLAAIDNGKKELKRSLCANQMIAMHQEELFKFQDVKPTPDEVKKYEWEHVFAKTLDDLLVKQEKATPGASETYFRIAVVKCDLDGMGDLFKSIKDYRQYGKLSKILSEHISMSALAKLVGEIKEKSSGFKLYPFYAAGDDLFFAVPVSQILQAMRLCEQLLKNINAEIEKAITGRKFSLLSLSVGIDFAINHEPIRYYYERVEAQLSAAKQAGIDHIPQEAKNRMRIAMNHYVLYHFQKEEEKEEEEKKKIEIPYWPHFLHTVKLVKSLEAEGFATHHFLYGLLAKITDPQIQGSDSEIRYSNAVLYHLLPQYINGPKVLRERELRLLEALFALFTVVKEGGKQHDLSFGREQRNNLERYVRLLLFFSDPRFQVAQQLGDLKNEKFDSTSIRRAIFNRGLRYLFKYSLVEGKDAGERNRKTKLRSFFAQEAKYRPPDKEKDVEVYRVMPLSSSLFYRMKQIQELETIAKMLLAANASAYEEAPTTEEDKSHSDAPGNTAPPPRLSFKEANAKGFLKAANGCWSKDYIDSLLIFYQLRELSIRYKTLYSTNNTAKAGNKHGKH